MIHLGRRINQDHLQEDLSALLQRLKIGKNLHVTLPPIGAISFENFQARTSPVDGGSVRPSRWRWLSSLGSAMVGR
jgi:hypothetical protein